jgi:hypothetical protein
MHGLEMVCVRGTAMCSVSICCRTSGAYGDATHITEYNSDPGAVHSIVRGERESRIGRVRVLSQEEEPQRVAPMPCIHLGRYKLYHVG